MTIGLALESLHAIPRLQKSWHFQELAGKFRAGNAPASSRCTVLRPTGAALNGLSAKSFGDNQSQSRVIGARRHGLEPGVAQDRTGRSA